MDDVRLIDSKPILEKLKVYYDALSPDVQSELIRRDEVSSCIAELINAPTIDAQPVKHGEWIVPKNDDEQPYCSVCNWHAYGDLFTDYCPGCGAYMVGD